LDGYWILCAALDAVNLRARAMLAVKQWASRAPGATRPSTGLLAYGAVAFCAPLLLVLPTVATYATVAQRVQAAPSVGVVSLISFAIGAVCVVGRARLVSAS
jgi:hypothetical protein